jgi:uncharacterized coiled-coil DUF342 family protein
MLEKYDEFKNKRKTIDNQIAGLKKKKLMVKLDQFNAKKAELQKNMNKFVSGSSNYN